MLVFIAMRIFMFIFHMHSEIILEWTCGKSIGEGNGTPLQYSCLENPMDGGAWKAAVHEVAEGRTWLSDFTFTFHFHALEKDGNPLQRSCLENPRDGGAWWAAVYGVAQSRTRLKRLSSTLYFMFSEILYSLSCSLVSFSLNLFLDII